MTSSTRPQRTGTDSKDARRAGDEDRGDEEEEPGLEGDGGGGGRVGLPEGKIK